MPNNITQLNAKPHCLVLHRYVSAIIIQTLNRARLEAIKGMYMQTLVSQYLTGMTTTVQASRQPVPFTDLPVEISA